MGGERLLPVALFPKPSGVPTASGRFSLLPEETPSVREQLKEITADRLQVIALWVAFVAYLFKTAFLS